jgi:ABC-2 type transport system ATP-binding protein
VLGVDPRADHRRELRDRVGVRLQNGAAPAKLTVREVLDLYASCYQRPVDPRTLIDALDLTAKRGTYVKKLSGGQKRVVRNSASRSR